MPFKTLSLWVLFLNFAVVLIVLLFRGLLPPVVPLFYGKPYGVEQLASAASLAFPPLAALGLSIVNILVAAFIEDEFLNKVIFGSMVVVTVLSIITVLKIFFLVGDI